ncbi:unnamed protein product [Sphagnum balticum]
MAALLLVTKLQRESESDLFKAVKAKKISDALNKIDHDVYKLLTESGDRDANEAGGVTAGITSWYRETSLDFRNLWLICQDDPELTEKLVEVNGTIKQVIAVVRELQRSYFVSSDDGREARQPMWRKLRILVNNNLIDQLQDFNKNVQKIIDRSPETQARLRQQQQQLMLGAALLNILITTFLGIYLTRLIALRLKTLADNASRFSENLPLLPVIGGHDEIASVDESFRDMATKVTESAKRESMLLNNAVATICSFDESGHFTAANSRASFALHFDPKQLTEMQLKDVITPEESNRFLQQVKASGEPYSQEFTLAGKDGKKTDTLWTAQWSESDRQVFCVIQDISGQREAERLKSRLQAMLTHDLKTPLMTVDNALRKLIQNRAAASGPSPVEGGRDDLLLAARNVGRLSNLVANFLDYEKLSAGGISVILEAVPLSECFVQVKDTTAGVGGEGVSLVVEDTPLIVKADFELLSRVLVNLVANALKFAPPGSSVTLSATSVDDKASICVSDRGPGIPADRLNRIFEEYYQADEQTKKQGHGLGLAIAKYFAEVQGGRLAVKSNTIEGTQFYFELPIWYSAT